MEKLDKSAFWKIFEIVLHKTVRRKVSATDLKIKQIHKRTDVYIEICVKMKQA